MEQDRIDWRALERLRAGFLDGTAGRQDYWRSESDLASYDATFAQRIGWKWDYVLLELQRRGWSPPPGELLDWGCGTGIAGRAFLDHFGTQGVSGLRYWDRSPLARQYAIDRAHAKYPGLPVAGGVPDEPAVALVSHVLTELDPKQTEDLADQLAARATAILWVEPGTYEASLTLIAVRERLRERLNVVAPCTHQQRCGLLAPGNETHWCHHFAPPPPAVFTDPDWGKFAQLTGIDLRSVALSFIVFDRRPVPPLPEGATRLIGRPRTYKAHASLLGSGAGGVREYRLTRRDQPAAFRQARKDELDPLQLIESTDGEIVSLRPLFPEAPDH